MKAIFVPADLNQPMKEVEADDFKGLADMISMTYPERVNTQKMHDEDMVMVVHDDGYAMGLPINIRACIISEYQGHDIVGDVLILSEGRSSEGISFFSVRPGIMELLTSTWRVDQTAQRILTKLKARQN